MPTPSVSLEEIVLPKIIQHPANSAIKKIADVIKNDERKCQEFFVTLKSEKKKLVLIDGYDVYCAVKKLGIKTINAHIVKGSIDSQVAYMISSNIIYTNPIMVTRIMADYVERHGMEKTLETLHLKPSFAKIFNFDFPEKTKNRLEKLFSDAYAEGAQTTVPYSLIKWISEIDESAQIMVIEKMDTLRDTLGPKFRWPHNDTLEKFINAKEKKKDAKKLKTRDPTAGPTVFSCECGNKHLISDGRVSKYKEKSGMVVMEGDDSKPLFGLGKKHANFLKIKPNTHPVIITSEDADPKKILQDIKGKRFIIFLSPETPSIEKE